MQPDRRSAGRNQLRKNNFLESSTGVSVRADRKQRETTGAKLLWKSHRAGLFQRVFLRIRRAAAAPARVRTLAKPGGFGVCRCRVFGGCRIMSGRDKFVEGVNDDAGAAAIKCVGVHDIDAVVFDGDHRRDSVRL